MGLLKEIFSNMDEPALIIQWSKSDNEEVNQLKEENRRLKEMLVSQKVNDIIDENKRLKKQLAMRRINAIEAENVNLID